MKVSHLPGRRKKVENGLACLQVLATHLCNKYLLNTFVFYWGNASMSKANGSNKGKIFALMTGSRSNKRNQTVNKANCVGGWKLEKESEQCSGKWGVWVTPCDTSRRFWCLSKDQMAVRSSHGGKVFLSQSGLSLPL